MKINGFGFFGFLDFFDALGFLGFLGFFGFLALLFLLLPSLALAASPTLHRTLDRVPSLDPAFAESVSAGRAVALCYETLLEYDYVARPYRLKGGLAKDLPEISDDGMTLTFHLREGVLFKPDLCFGATNATRELTAEDVVYTLKRLADAKLSSPCYWIVEDKVAGLKEFRERSKGKEPTDYDFPVAGLLAPDRHTFQLRLSGPAPQILWGLALGSTGVVPREAVEFYGNSDFGQREVGTGPFRLVSWRRNYRMEFQRKELMSEESEGARKSKMSKKSETSEMSPSSAIERIVFHVMDDSTTKWMSFLLGDLDLEGSIPRDTWDAVVRPVPRERRSPDRHLDTDAVELVPEIAQQGIRMLSQSAMDCYYIAFNMDDPVVGTNKKLRQALSCAYDYAAVASLSPGRLAPSIGPVPPNVTGRLDTPPPYPFDVERAKRLLAEAGYPGGKDPATGRRLTLTLELGRTDHDTREVAELLRSFFDAIGVVLEANYNNWPAFLQKIGRRQAQMFQLGWIADYPDAENFLQLFYGKNASPGPNRCNYANPDFDALYERALRTTDVDERLDCYRAMQEQVREDCPWIFLYHRKEVLLLHDRVQNVLMHDFPYGMEKHWRLTL